MADDQTGTPPNTGAVPPSNTPDPNAGKPWFDGVDGETAGYLQARGWDKLDGNSAAREAIKAHREAEKLLGAPQDQLIRVPKDANDTANWANVYKRIGVPDKAEEYDLSPVKFSNGTPVPPTEAARVQQWAKEMNLTKTQATLLASNLVKIAEEQGASYKAQAEGMIASETEALKASWGSNFNPNKIVAENTMKNLGIPQDAIDALTKTAGYAKTMEAFRSMGQKLGEDKFIQSQNGTGNPVTKEEAQYTLNQLQNDAAWMKRFSEGDVMAAKQFNDLTKMLV